MGFSFDETMAGTIEWDAEPGVKRPFRFEVTAEAGSTRTHLKDGKAVEHWAAQDDMGMMEQLGLAPDLG